MKNRLLSVFLSAVLAVAFCPGLGLVAQSVAPEPSFAAVQTQVMYRLYNPNSGEHFYTADAGERDSVAAAGWDYEGEGWTAPVSSNTPVYRLYSGTDHHYCMDIAERDALIGFGWTDEGTGWYSDDAQGVPLYRQFNPNVDPTAPTNNSGSHNYTIDRDEHNFLVSVGWNDEGVGWYGVDTMKGDSSTPSTPSTPDVSGSLTPPSAPIAPEGVVYQENVMEIPDRFYSDLSESTVTVSGLDMSSLGPGSVLLLDPTAQNPAGSALKVQSTSQEHGASVVTFEPAELGDVVKSMNVSGTTNNVIAMTPDVEVVDSRALSAMEIQTSIPFDQVTFKPIDGAEVTITPSVDFSFDFAFGKLNSCELLASVEVDAEFKWKGNDKPKEVSKKLCTTTFSTPVFGLTVTADFYLVASATGRVNIEANLKASAGVEFTSGKIRPVSKCKLAYDAELYAKLTAGAEEKLTLSYFGIGLVDVAPEVGVAAEGSVEIHGEQLQTPLVCIDIAAYPYIDLHVGEGSTLLGFAMDALKIEKVYHPLNRSNSFVIGAHVENGKKVNACTWNNEAGDAGSDVEAGDDESISWADFPTTPTFRDTGQYLGDALVSPFVIHAGSTFTIGDPSDASADRYRFLNNAKSKKGSVIRISVYDDYGNLVSKYYLTPGNPYENATWVEGSNKDEFWGDGDVPFQKKIVIEVLHGSLLIRNIQAAHVPPWEMGTCEQYDSTEEAKKAIEAESPITQPTSEN